jgi:hypothetical protein
LESQLLLQWRLWAQAIAIEHSTMEVPTNRFMPLKADFRLNDHQRPPR